MEGKGVGWLVFSPDGFYNFSANRHPLQDYVFLKIAKIIFKLVVIISSSNRSKSHISLFYVAVQLRPINP